MTREEFLAKYKPSCDGCAYSREGDLDIAAGEYVKVYSCGKMVKEVKGDFCLVPGTGCRLYVPKRESTENKG
jgi:hypothetical protein